MKNAKKHTMPFSKILNITLIMNIDFQIAIMYGDQAAKNRDLRFLDQVEGFKNKDKIKFR